MHDSPLQLLQRLCALYDAPSPDYDVQPTGCGGGREWVCNLHTPAIAARGLPIMAGGDPELLVDENWFQGEASTPEAAEQAAAQVALDSLQEQPDVAAAFRSLPRHSHAGEPQQVQDDGSLHLHKTSTVPASLCQTLNRLLGGQRLQDLAVDSELRVYLHDVEQHAEGWLPLGVLTQAKLVQQWAKEQLGPRSVEDRAALACVLHDTLTKESQQLDAQAAANSSFILRGDGWAVRRCPEAQTRDATMHVAGAGGVEETDVAVQARHMHASTKLQVRIGEGEGEGKGEEGTEREPRQPLSHMPLSVAEARAILRKREAGRDKEAAEHLEGVKQLHAQQAKHAQHAQQAQQEGGAGHQASLTHSGMGEHMTAISEAGTAADQLADTSSVVAEPVAGASTADMDTQPTAVEGTTGASSSMLGHATAVLLPANIRESVREVHVPTKNGLLPTMAAMLQAAGSPDKTHQADASSLDASAASDTQHDAANALSRLLVWGRVGLKSHRLAPPSVAGTLTAAAKRGSREATSQSPTKRARMMSSAQQQGTAAPDKGSQDEGPLMSLESMAPESGTGRATHVADAPAGSEAVDATSTGDGMARQLSLAAWADSTKSLRAHKGPAAMDWDPDNSEVRGPEVHQLHISAAAATTPAEQLGRRSADPTSAVAQPGNQHAGHVLEVPQPSLYTLLPNTITAHHTSDSKAALGTLPLNMRASWLVGAPVRGDALLATCRPTHDKEDRPDVRWSSFGIPDWWRCAAELTPGRAYVRSRHTPMISRLPHSYWSHTCWSGPLPTQLLQRYTRRISTWLHTLTAPRPTGPMNTSSLGSTSTTQPHTVGTQSDVPSFTAVEHVDEAEAREAAAAVAAAATGGSSGSLTAGGTAHLTPHAGLHETSAEAAASVPGASTPSSVVATTTSSQPEPQPEGGGQQGEGMAAGSQPTAEFVRSVVSAATGGHLGEQLQTHPEVPAVVTAAVVGALQATAPLGQVERQRAATTSPPGQQPGGSGGQHGHRPLASISQPTTPSGTQQQALGSTQPALGSTQPALGITQPGVQADQAAASGTQLEQPASRAGSAGIPVETLMAVAEGAAAAAVVVAPHFGGGQAGAGGAHAAEPGTLAAAAAAVAATAVEDLATQAEQGVPPDVLDASAAVGSATLALMPHSASGSLPAGAAEQVAAASMMYEVQTGTETEKQQLAGLVAREPPDAVEAASLAGVALPTMLHNMARPAEKDVNQLQRLDMPVYSATLVDAEAPQVVQVQVTARSFDGITRTANSGPVDDVSLAEQQAALALLHQLQQADCTQLLPDQEQWSAAAAACQEEVRASLQHLLQAEYAHVLPSLQPAAWPEARSDQAPGGDQQATACEPCWVAKVFYKMYIPSSPATGTATPASEDVATTAGSYVLEQSTANLVVGCGMVLPEMEKALSDMTTGRQFSIREVHVPLEGACDPFHIHPSVPACLDLHLLSTTPAAPHRNRTAPSVLLAASHKPSSAPTEGAVAASQAASQESMAPMTPMTAAQLAACGVRDMFGTQPLAEVRAEAILHSMREAEATQNLKFTQLIDITTGSAAASNSMQAPRTFVAKLLTTYLPSLPELGPALQHVVSLCADQQAASCLAQYLQPHLDHSPGQVQQSVEEFTHKPSLKRSYAKRWTNSTAGQIVEGLIGADSNAPSVEGPMEEEGEGGGGGLVTGEAGITPEVEVITLDDEVEVITLDDEQGSQPDADIAANLKTLQSQSGVAAGDMHSNQDAGLGGQGQQNASDQDVAAQGAPATGKGVLSSVLKTVSNLAGSAQAKTAQAVHAVQGAAADAATSFQQSYAAAKQARDTGTQSSEQEARASVKRGKPDTGPESAPQHVKRAHTSGSKPPGKQPPAVVETGDTTVTDICMGSTSLEAAAGVPAALGSASAVVPDVSVWHCGGELLASGNVTSLPGVVRGGCECVTLVECVQQLEPGQASRLVKGLLSELHPAALIVSTPCANYNTVLRAAMAVQSCRAQRDQQDQPDNPTQGVTREVLQQVANVWPGMPGADGLPMRHPASRFEWTRREFRTWALQLAQEHGYTTTFTELGHVHDEASALNVIEQLQPQHTATVTHVKDYGAATQMVTFIKQQAAPSTAEVSREQVPSSTVWHCQLPATKVTMRPHSRLQMYGATGAAQDSAPAVASAGTQKQQPGTNAASHQLGGPGGDDFNPPASGGITTSAAQPSGAVAGSGAASQQAEEPMQTDDKLRPTAAAGRLIPGPVDHGGQSAAEQAEQEVEILYAQGMDELPSGMQAGDELLPGPP